MVDGLIYCKSRVSRVIVWAKRIEYGSNTNSKPFPHVITPNCAALRRDMTRQTNRTSNTITPSVLIHQHSRIMLTPVTYSFMLPPDDWVSL